MMVERTVYECGFADHCGDEELGSAIGYCDDEDIWERFETGAWTPCCWDSETGIEWIETGAGELLVLKPVSEHQMPNAADIGEIDTERALATSESDTDD